jgi:plastocyanin
VSHLTHRTHRATALALAVGIGLLSACSDGGGDAAGAAAGAAASTGAHAEGEHSAGTTPESTGPGSTAPGSSPGSAAPESAAPGTTAPESSAAPAEARTVTASEGEMYIDLSEDAFTPGSYTIEVVNEGKATHDLVVERDGEDVAATENIGPGESATLTVTLEEGDYVFYCSIGNHRAMGMATTVTVGA